MAAAVASGMAASGGLPVGEPECQTGAVRLELCLSWQGWPLSQGQRSFQERRRGGFAVAKANLDFHFILYALAARLKILYSSSGWNTADED